MDLVEYSQDRFEHIVRDYSAFAARLPFVSVVAIPVAARYGENIVRPGQNMSWYSGPTVLQHLETVDADSGRDMGALRFPVQWVNRMSSEFRGLAGTVAAGRVRTGDSVVVAGSGVSSTVARIVTADGELTEATTGEAVTLVLARDIDVSRGDVLADPRHPPCFADQLAAHLLWMDDEPLLPGRSYVMRIGTRWIPCRVTAIKHKLDVHSLDQLAARTLEPNEIGFCNLATASAVAFDPYEVNRTTGAFILVDRFTDRTVAAGTISFELRRAANVHPEELAISKAERARLKAQQPCVVWFTGLPASGKSTIARRVESLLHAGGIHTYMLDGDNLRHGLNSDLGFTNADRVENIRRIGEVAKLFVDAGLIVLCAFISPFRAERQAVRELFGAKEFLEVFVDTPFEECERRDPKGLYAKARAGTVKNFTGFDSPYERPLEPELALSTADQSADQLALRVVERLRADARIG
jgi:bifunctional enzyme CysN/CysC